MFTDRALCDREAVALIGVGLRIYVGVPGYDNVPGNRTQLGAPLVIVTGVGLMLVARVWRRSRGAAPRSTQADAGRAVSSACSLLQCSARAPSASKAARRWPRCRGGPA